MRVRLPPSPLGSRPVERDSRGGQPWGVSQGADGFPDRWRRHAAALPRSTCPHSESHVPTGDEAIVLLGSGPIRGGRCSTASAASGRRRGWERPTAGPATRRSTAWRSATRPWCASSSRPRPPPPAAAPRRPARDGPDHHPRALCRVAAGGLPAHGAAPGRLPPPRRAAEAARHDRVRLAGGRHPRHRRAHHDRRRRLRRRPARARVMGNLQGMPASQLAVLSGTSHFIPPGRGLLDRAEWLLAMIRPSSTRPCPPPRDHPVAVIEPACRARPPSAVAPCRRGAGPRIGAASRACGRAPGSAGS